MPKYKLISLEDEPAKVHRQCYSSFHTLKTRKNDDSNSTCIRCSVIYALEMTQDRKLQIITSNCHCAHVKYKTIWWKVEKEQNLVMPSRDLSLVWGEKNNT